MVAYHTCLHFCCSDELHIAILSLILIKKQTFLSDFEMFSIHTIYLNRRKRLLELFLCSSLLQQITTLFVLAEKKIFDDWFEEKADEYVPWIRNHGSDDETIHANVSVSFIL